MRLLLAVFAAWWALACGGAARPARLTPADIPALESARAQHPDDPGTNLRLAQAYYAAGRFADAKASARLVCERQPGNAQARVYLGLAYEGLTLYDSAQAVYSTLLASQPDKSVRRLLAGRLAIVAHALLLTAARQAIASESLLAATPSDPHTIAVLPFRYGGSDSAFRPLERGLAAVVVTDLSRVHELRVVERARLQALLDELHLAQGAQIDPATGARSGRLLRAGQVVEGQFTTDSASRIRIDATVVRAGDAAVAASGSHADQLKALFDVEKAVVFQLLASLNITLTPGERVAISERPTHDLQAFLLYSRGLEQSDVGDFAAAAASFNAASQLDPGFTQAAQQAAASQAAQTASAAPAADLASAVANAAPPVVPSPPGTGALAAAINGTVPGGAGVLDAVASSSAIATPVTDPNRICEGATCDGPARAALIGTITIILRLP